MSVQTTRICRNEFELCGRIGVRQEFKKDASIHTGSCSTVVKEKGHPTQYLLNIKVNLLKMKRKLGSF